MSRSVASGQSASTAIRKEDVAKLKRAELQGLCKEKSLRANGTNAAMIEALAAHFDGISIGGRPPASAASIASVRTPSRVVQTSLSKTPITRSMRLLLESPVSSPASSTDSDHTTSTLPAINSSRMAAPRISKQAAPVSRLKENQDGPSNPGKDAQEQTGNARGTKSKADAVKQVPLKQPRLSAGSALGPSKSATPSRARASIGSASGIASSNKTSQTFVLDSLHKRIEDLASALATQNEELARQLEAQGRKLEEQEELIDNLQTSLDDAHSLLAATRQVMVEELSLDVASCVQQTSDLVDVNAGTDERLSLVESELFMKEGKIYQAMKEIGDLDVAMASERDRLSKLVEKVAVLAARVVGETPAAFPAFEKGSVLPQSSGKRHFARDSGVSEGMAMDFQMADTDRDSLGSEDPITPLTHGKRLSRASISAVLHALPPPTSRTSSNNHAHDGIRRDFRFPAAVATDASSNRFGSSGNNASNLVRKQRNTAGGPLPARSRVQSSVDGETGVARQSTPAFSRIRTMSALSASASVGGRQMSTTITTPDDQTEDSLISGITASPARPACGTPPQDDDSDAKYLRRTVSGPRRRSGSAAFLRKDLLARSSGPSRSSRPSDASEDDHQSDPEEEQFSLMDQPQPSFSALGTDDDYAAEASTGGEEDAYDE